MTLWVAIHPSKLINDGHTYGDKDGCWIEYIQSTLETTRTFESGTVGHTLCLPSEQNKSVSVILSRRVRASAISEPM